MHFMGVYLLQVMSLKYIFSELEADKISNFKQALDWLICATEQAHPEARRMLRR